MPTWANLMSQSFSVSKTEIFGCAKVSALASSLLDIHTYCTTWTQRCNNSWLFVVLVDLVQVPFADSSVVLDPIHRLAGRNANPAPGFVSYRLDQTVIRGAYTRAVRRLQMIFEEEDCGLRELAATRLPRGLEVS